MSAGRFSLLSFYERRARRILPALLVVTLACIPFALRWMMPSELKDFSASVGGVGLFVSNFVFAHQTGYFAAAAETKPLLHTWTLAVEEQYYLLFPIFLLLIWRLGRRWMLGAFLAIAAASFLSIHVGSSYAPNAKFFLLPARGWELLIGACAALMLMNARFANFAVDEKDRNFAIYRNLLGSAGIALIGYALFAFGRRTPSPSAYILIPAVGTALIILFAHRDTIIARALGFKPLVGLGLISYSLYLWHQPLFAFYRIRSPFELTAYIYAGLIAASIALAWLSWQFVEQPFRDSQKIGRRRLAGICIGGGVALLIVGALGYLTDGLAGRTLGDGTTLGQLEERFWTNYGFSVDCESGFMRPQCRTSNEPELAVWGDSYAMHLVPGIIASKRGIKMIQMTKEVCGPIYQLAPTGISIYDTHWAAGCVNFNNSVFDWIEEHKSVKYVVLASSFSQYVSSDVNFLTADGVKQSDPRVAFQHLMYTLELLASRGIKPVVIAPTPADGRDTGRCLMRSRLFEFDSSVCDVSYKKSLENQAKIRELLKKVNEYHKVIWLEDYMCKDGTCQSVMDGKFIYRDRGHLSIEGSEYLGREINIYHLITQ